MENDFKFLNQLELFNNDLNSKEELKNIVLEEYNNKKERKKPKKKCYQMFYMDKKEKMNCKCGCKKN